MKPFPGQIRLRNDVPRKALVYLLSQIGAESGQSFHLPDPVVREIAQAEEPKYTIPRFELPSRKSQDSQATTAVEQEQLTWTLKWQSVTPAGDSLRYRNEIESYIWQPFCKPPSPTYVKIFVFNKAAPSNIRVVLFFGSIKSLETFRQERTACADIFNGTEKVAFRLAHQIYGAYRVALSDMMAFLQMMADEIFAMIFKGRASPSRLKVQHLLHMNDCGEKAIQDMTRNLSHLDEWEHIVKSLLTPFENPTSVENTTDGKHLETAIETLRSDLGYVLSKLESMEPELSALQREIESQNSLKSPNFALNTLAAIYVPLAFVTSFLGMNVTESPVKKWLSPNVPSNGQDAPTQRLWDMRWFAVLSAPLLLGTILLPLLAGPVVRWTFQKYDKLGIFWRVIFMLIPTVYLILYYVVTYDNDSSASYVLSWPLTIVCDSLLAAFTLYHGYIAFRLEERGALWTFTWVLALTLTCFLLDFLPFDTPHLLYGGFGWFIILVARLYSYSRGWDAEEKTRKALDTAGEEPIMRIRW